MNIDIKVSNRNKKSSIVWVLILSACMSVGTLQAQTSLHQYDEYLKTEGDSLANELKQLATELQVAIYLTDNQTQVKYGVGPTQVVYCDSESVPMLQNMNTDYNSVRLLSINVKDPGESNFTFNLSELVNFTSLQFILLTFQYDICGNLSDECLDPKSDETVQNPDGQPITVLYRLMIPE